MEKIIIMKVQTIKKVKMNSKKSKNELFTKLGFLDNFKIKKKIKNEIEKDISKKQNSNSKKPKSKEKIKNN